jgi:thiosulfate reductase cytochrome b subunit
MESQAGSFRGQKSLVLRIWHWVDAGVILGLLGTALLRKTFLSWRTNSELIQNKLAEAGTPIGDELAKEIAVAIRTPMWEFHYLLGYALSALLVGRIIISFLPGQPSMFLHLKDFLTAATRPPLHFMGVKALYSLFYVVVTFMVVSGLLMMFKTELGLAKSLTGQLKEIHELAMWFFAGFAAIHTVGVVVAENRDDAGLVSDMISGGDRNSPT